MNMLARTPALTAAFLILTSCASAEVLDAHWESVNGDPGVASSVQNNLIASMTEDWTNAVLKVTLTAGSLINPAVGTLGERRLLSPEEDSWLDAPNAPSSNISIIRADYTEDEDGNPGGQFDWFDTDFNGPCTDGLAARIYATDDAVGTWELEMYDVDGGPTIYGSIANGAFADLGTPGDKDGDGDVDVADLMAWQRTDGSASGLDDWRAGFGTGSALVGSIGAVPEPASLSMIGVIVSLATLRRFRVRSTPAARVG